MIVIVHASILLFILIYVLLHPGLMKLLVRCGFKISVYLHMGSLCKSFNEVGGLSRRLTIICLKCFQTHFLLSYPLVLLDNAAILL